MTDINKTVNLHDLSLGQIRDSFQTHIEEDANKEPLSTGIPSLDKLLDGGITKQLYIIGAESGAGKTSLCLNISQAIAEQDHPVLYLSLEMSMYAILAKLTAISAAHDSKSDKVISASEIVRTTQYKEYPEQKRNAILSSLKAISKKMLDNIFILPKERIIDLDIVQAYIERISGQNGNAPVIVVDYLQIFADHVCSGKSNVSDKDRIDEAVAFLHTLCSKYNAPVFAISSINRDSYHNTNQIKTYSYKGSGSIEYSADILLSLEKPKKKSGHTADTNTIIIKKLKDRMGELGNCTLFFNGATGCFTDTADIADSRPKSSCPVPDTSKQEDDPSQINVYEAEYEALLRDLRAELKKKKSLTIGDAAHHFNRQPYEINDMIRGTDVVCEDGLLRLIKQ